VIAGLLLLLVWGLAAAATVGSVGMRPLAVGEMVLNRLGLARFPATWSPQEETILFVFRLPRAVAAALVGAALATAGALFQGLLRNPLADPYVVGTSGGAALGAVLGSLLGDRIAVLGFGPVPLLAFAGALGALALVYQLARVGGRVPVVSVLLAGFAVSSLLGYTGSLLMILDSRLQVQLPQIYARLLGGITVAGWSEVRMIGPLVLLGIAGSLTLTRTLDALSLGEEGAARLGIPVERHKLWLLGLGSLLTAAAVSISGLVGFVGLIVPHAMRLACGPVHRLLLPASAVAGALFLVLADLLARTAAPPAEMPVGIVTALLGGPFFLWLLRRTKREYVW